jgi:hypothetical protein
VLAWLLGVKGRVVNGVVGLLSCVGLGNCVGTGVYRERRGVENR